MGGDNNIQSMPISSLPYQTRNLLNLLDTQKVLPTEGPERLPRDWRGLASLLNISAEIAASIKEHKDRVSKVLELWMMRKDGTDTVGQLLDFLQKIDRYDIYDDICDDLRELNQTEGIVAKQPETKVEVNEDEPDLITYDDKPGHIQQYHAFVLFSEADKEFVHEMIRRMKSYGFMLCTVDDLLPGHPTPYAPVAQLISQRCRRIVLVYSPEFLSSPANNFYRDYAQALSIERNQRRIIPIMYRECQLPAHLMYYHKLHYSGAEGRAMYNFWVKLKQSLDITRFQPQSNGGSELENSELKITELLSNFGDDLFLPQSSAAQRSISMGALETLRQAGDSLSLGSLTQLSQLSQSSQLIHTPELCHDSHKKKKKSTLKKILGSLSRKREKETLMVANC